jgi:hypothetical protein
MKIIDYETFRMNPFRIDSKHIRVYVKTEVDTSSGEAETKVRSGDFEKHIRIFPSAYDKIGNINSMALRLMSYIFSNVSDDLVRLNVKELVPIMGINSPASIYRGILSLLDEGFIARKVGGDMFFINPKMFYPGSRAEWHKKIIDEESKD